MNTNDHISQLGYSRNSPYGSNPYLDIHSPEGKITMENTDIDLLGIDNVGNVQYMKAGTKNPYQFKGSIIREIPMQDGGLIPNIGNKGMLGEGTIEDALNNSKHLKIQKSGNFKGLIPLEDFNDDVMNYIDKFKVVQRRHQTFVKVRGTLPKPEQSTPPATNNLSLQRGGYSRQQIAQDFFDYTDEDNDYQQSAPEASHVADEIKTEPQTDYKLLYEQKLQEEMDNYAIQIANTEDEYLPRRNSASNFSQMDPNFSSSGFHLPGNQPGFQAFGSYQQGRAALENQLNLYKSGQSAHTKGNETLAQATSIYAPPSENNTSSYIDFVSKQLGVSPDTPISQLDTKKWADAIEKKEGNRVGNNPGNLRRYQKGGLYRKLK